MYVIKKIGLLTKEQQIKLIKSFKDKNDEIFFIYHLPVSVSMNEKEIKKLVAETTEIVSEDYFQHIYHMYNGVEIIIRNKIEKILKAYIEKKSHLQLNCLNILLENTMAGNFEKLDIQTIYDIKYTICYGLLVNNYDKYKHEEMKKRKVFESRIRFDEDGKHEDAYLEWWFAVDNDEELWSRAMYENFGEGMIVTDRNKPIECFSYALVYVETAEDYDLQVYTGEKDNFEKNIVPKIADINLDIVKNIQKY